MMTTEYLTDMCPSITAACDLLRDVLPRTDAMDYPAFGSFYCMLLEEWCLHHQMDITEIISEISTLIHDVNTIEGKYQAGIMPLFESEVRP